MNRRTFLKLSGSAFAMSLVPFQLFAKSVTEISMEDLLIIKVHDESPMIFININGRHATIPTNTKAIAKRKYVEALAKAKVHRYRETPSGMKESIENQYPFTVIKDPNTEGAKWLAQL